MTPKKETEDKYKTGQVATQTETVVIDQETEETLTLVDMMVRIANDIDELKKKLL
jgi:hypothetical protein